MKALSFTVQKLWPRLMFFLQVKKSTRSRSKGQSCWYPVKGLLTNIIYVKYKCPGIYCSKDMAKVKVKNFHVKVGQTPRSRSKGQSYCYQMKGLDIKIKYVKYESTSLNL